MTVVTRAMDVSTISDDSIPPDTEVVLRVTELTKRYGKHTAVDSLTFEVRRGELFGFLGPNGAGKTTVISLILGLIRPHAGRVQILNNLPYNTLRHTPAGGVIVVETRPLDNTFIEIAVTDTGVGISDDALPYLFDRFFRGGSGLGLSIVKHLVEAQGDTISAESAAGHGTTLRFTLLPGGVALHARNCGFCIPCCGLRLHPLCSGGGVCAVGGEGDNIWGYASCGAYPNRT